MTSLLSVSKILSGSLLVLAAPLNALAENAAESTRGCVTYEQDEKYEQPGDGGSGWTLKAVGGFGWLGDTDLSSSLGLFGPEAGPVGGPIAGEATYDSGFAAGMSVGYDFGRFRVEAEYLYQTNDAKSFSLGSGSAGTPLGVGGDFSSVVVSANLIGEFNVFGSDRAQSYAGAGLAWLQEVDIDLKTADGERSFSTDDIGFQVFAGVDYKIAERWSASLEARYLAVGKLNLALEGEEQAQTSGNLAADYDRTSILFGLSYRF